MRGRQGPETWFSKQAKRLKRQKKNKRTKELITQQSRVMLTLVSKIVALKISFTCLENLPPQKNQRAASNGSFTTAQASKHIPFLHTQRKFLEKEGRGRQSMCFCSSSCLSARPRALSLYLGAAAFFLPLTPPRPPCHNTSQNRNQLHAYLCNNNKNHGPPHARQHAAAALGFDEASTCRVGGLGGGKEGRGQEEGEEERPEKGGRSKSNDLKEKGGRETV